MKYGIRDGMLRLPFEQTFAEAKRIGFDGVEICIGGNYREHKLWSEEGIAEIQKLSADANIETPSLSPGGFTSYTFAHPDESHRDEGKAMLKHLIKVCPKIGADAILVPFFGNGKINPEDITSPIFIGGIKEVAEVAETHKVYLALESTLNADDHLRILEQVKSPYVKVYYDMGNATGFGYNAAEEIKQMGSEIVIIHVKDTGGHPGEGKVDFSEVSAAIREIKYDGYLVLETPSGDDASASAVRNLAFSKKIFD
ncbi:sugar phosphate isomerase/epimerase [bacterium]|nr:sugar phosphate isomerase/epimerase [bacterium]